MNPESTSILQTPHNIPATYPQIAETYYVSLIYSQIGHATNAIYIDLTIKTATQTLVLKKHNHLYELGLMKMPIIYHSTLGAH